MKTIKYLIIICLAICIILGVKLWIYMFTNTTNFQMLPETIGSLEMKSVATTDVKYTIQKTFQLTNSDGTPAPFHIVKFECCGVGGMVKNGEIYIGTINETLARPVFATTSQMVPVIEMPTIVHELVHQTTKHYATSSACIDINNRFWQEKIAYNAEWLYRQMMMFDEDGYYKISK